MFYTFLIFKNRNAVNRDVNMSNSVSVLFFSVAFGHKRGVASYRDRCQAAGSKAHNGDMGYIYISLLSLALVKLILFWPVIFHMLSRKVL